MSITKKQLKKGTSYQVKWRDETGRQKSKTFRTLRDARSFHDREHVRRRRAQMHPEDLESLVHRERQNKLNNEFHFKGLSPEPAYLGWGVPYKVISRRGSPLTGDDGYLLLSEWHDSRCAMCGNLTYNTVVDHCHETGLVRGLLCSGCNTQEGFAGDSSMKYEIYRAFPPAKILGVHIYYNDYGNSPYPTMAKIDKQVIESMASGGMVRWDPELCFLISEQYLNGQIDLLWMTRSELNFVLVNGLRFARENGKFL